jgi:hypothetical protein
MKVAHGFKLHTWTWLWRGVHDWIPAMILLNTARLECPETKAKLKYWHPIRRKHRNRIKPSLEYGTILRMQQECNLWTAWVFILSMLLEFSRNLITVCSYKFQKLYRGRETFPRNQDPVLPMLLECNSSSSCGRVKDFAIMTVTDVVLRIAVVTVWIIIT